MAVHRLKGSAPFVIDRAPPPFIERAPGNYSLVADREDATKPMEFASQDEAVEFLRQECEGDFSDFEWRIIPLDNLEPAE